MTPTITMPLPASHSHEAETLPSEWIARFVDDIPTGLAVFDRELRYVAANPVWTDAFRLACVSLAGQCHDELISAGGAPLAPLQRRALSGEIVDGCHPIAGDEIEHAQLRAISLRPRRGRDGTIVGVVATLHHNAMTTDAATGEHGFDSLTGVAGRDAFLARLRATLAGPGGPGLGTAMFLIDVEDFRGINDLYGAGAGDRVLKTIATRLLAGIRSRTPPAQSRRQVRSPEADLVARLGADEFAVILGSEAPSPAGMEAFAHRLLQLVAAPVMIGEQRIRLTANVGFLTSTAVHQTEDDALRDLNIALHEAKARGPNAAKAWEPTLTSQAGRRLALLDELRRALDEGEFVLHYQPILQLSDQSVIGAEALLRWNHPREGLVSPGEFLPLLEDSGLVVPVGCWVIREVVRQMQVWQMLYGRDMVDWVSVNVSARQFNDPTPVLATLNEINDSGFPLDRLKIEITESAVMRNPETTRSVLGELQDVGIRVALDDFGTGYSALGALRHYNVDMIKIDRDFTTRLDTPDGRQLVQALVRIARIYGAAVVAEGVETTQQRDVLRKTGCEFGQGYLFARPMDGSFFGAYALTHLVDDQPGT